MNNKVRGIKWFGNGSNSVISAVRDYMKKLYEAVEGPWTLKLDRCRYYLLSST